MTLFVFYLIIGLYMSLFVPLIIDEYHHLAKIDLQKITNNFREPITRITQQLQNIGIYIDLNKDLPLLLTEAGKKLFSGGLVHNIAGIVSGLGDVAALVFSVSFITFYFLKEHHLVRDIINAVTPDRHEAAIHRVINDSKIMLRRYFIGLIIQVSLLSALYFTGYKIIGVENAFLIAFISGVLNVIPFIGPIIGIGFSMLIVLSASLGEAGTGNLLGIMFLVFLVVRGIDDFFLQPIIFSNSVKAHPVEIFIIILMGARLGGIVGMIIAIPVYTVIRIIAKEFLAHYKPVRRLTKHL